jgi:hypothetical protein
MGWRDIARNHDVRTVIATVLPRVAVGHTAPLFFVNNPPSLSAVLLANFLSFTIDYL